MAGQVSRHPDVLVADDDPVTVISVQAALEAGGHATCAVASGTAAVRAAGEQRPRLVLLDVGMPDLDGYAVCRALRANPGTADLPVLFLSGFSGLDARIAGFQAGGIDYISKPFEPAELVARVDSHLEQAAARETLRRRNLTLVKANEGWKAQHRAARNFQRALLPEDEPADPRLQFAWRCVPCGLLCGDVVNIIRLSEGVFACYVLDASGHGLPASLVAAAASCFLTALCGNQISGSLQGSQAQPLPSPAAVLSTVGRVLAPMMASGQFITVVCCIIDANTQTFTYSSAGHPPPLLLRPSRARQTLDVGGPPPGVGEGDYLDHTIELAHGDRIVLYSDGLIEQRGPTGERMTRTVMEQWAVECSSLPIQECASAILRRFAGWRGALPPDDDVSLVIVDYTGGAA